MEKEQPSENTQNSAKRPSAEYIRPQPKAESIKSFNSYRSKFTTCSKLTQSQLYRTLSKSILIDKHEEQLKIRETEIEILENSIEGIKRSSEDFLRVTGELFERFDQIGSDLQKQIQTITED